MIEIFSVDNSLPDLPGLIERFITIRFEKDVEKFEFSTDLSEKRYHMRRALTRFAYGTQLLGCSSCSEETYQTILGDDDRNYIKHSSLTVKTPNGHFFAHNIFKEYLIAKHISQLQVEKIIEWISIPQAGGLNPNWFNIFGLILQLTLSEELVSWAISVEPLILTRLESDCLTQELRITVLKNVLADITRKNVWYSQAICSERQLALFSQSIESLDILINHIEHPVHFRSQYFCLRVLFYFSDLFGQETRVQAALVNCYRSEDFRPHEKRVAIAAIAALQLTTAEITSDLICRYWDSSSSYERLGVYDYLRQADICDENVDFLLHGVEPIAAAGHSFEEYDGVERHALIECLETLSDPVSIEKVLQRYAQADYIDTQSYGHEKLVTKIFTKATIAYNDGATAILEAIYTFLVSSEKTYHRYHIPDILRFLSATETIECVFTRLVNEYGNDMYFLVIDMIEYCPVLINKLCELYTKEKLKDPKILEHYAVRSHTDPAIFKQCADAIFKKTNEIIIQEEPREGHAQRQKRDGQVFFNCLFDQRAMHELVKQLAEFYGDPNISFNQMREKQTWHDDYPPGTHLLELTLLHSGFKKERIIDFVNLIDWDTFLVNRLCYLFKDQDSLGYLTITPEQHTAIIDAYHGLEKKFDLHTAISEGPTREYRISYDLYWYLTLKKALKLPSPNKYYMGLLEIPCVFVDDHANIERKYKIIEQHFSPKVIAQQVEKLTLEETRVCVLKDLIFGCNRYKIRTCKGVAIQLCKRNDLPAYDRREALNYLFAVFGKDAIVHEIMPTSDREMFKEIAAVLESVADDQLATEMLARYKKKQDLFLLKNLIRRNSKDGLQLYIDASRKINMPVDSKYEFGEVTEAISTINDIRLLPQLLDAVRMRFSNEFNDNLFHSLYSSLQDALSSCAKKEYVSVLSALDDLIEELSSNLDAISFCNVLKDRIIADHKMSFIKSWTVPEVREVLCSIS